jgi:hypothetical protein
LRGARRSRAGPPLETPRTRVPSTPPALSELSERPTYGRDGTGADPGIPSGALVAGQDRTGPSSRSRSGELPRPVSEPQGS